jgi:hypothetical protein
MASVFKIIFVKIYPTVNVKNIANKYYCIERKEEEHEEEEEKRKYS